MGAGTGGEERVYLEADIESEVEERAERKASARASKNVLTSRESRP